ncbi:MAG: hypothetical protein Q9170_008174 [Blastenia crenularia]
MSTVFQEELEEWFDIYSLTDPTRREDLQVQGLKDSIEYLLDVIEAEVQLIGAKRMVLLGISMGYAVAIHLLLASRHTLGGLVGMSGWMPFKRQVVEAQNQSGGVESFYANVLGVSGVEGGDRGPIPALVMHYEDDEFVDVDLGVNVVEDLEELGMDVAFKRYVAGGHWIAAPEGLDNIVAFLEENVWI